MAGRLQDKVAIVTGAASGIGAAAAARFAAEGAKVMCADLTESDLIEVVTRIETDGGTATAFTVDVTDREATMAMATAARDAYGEVDVLYANAGIAGVGTAMDCDPLVWDRVIGVNLTGVWHCMRAVLPQMVGRGGSIVNQASVGGLVGVPGIAPYAAAKAGVIGLTRQAAVEFGPDQIRINAICPGTAPTPLVVETYEARAGSGGVFDTIDEGLANAAKKYPIGRLGTVEDIANLALFLASDEAAWITGAVHVIDGGMTAA